MLPSYAHFQRPLFRAAGYGRHPVGPAMPVAGQAQQAPQGNAQMLSHANMFSPPPGPAPQQVQAAGGAQLQLAGQMPALPSAPPPATQQAAVQQAQQIQPAPISPPALAPRVLAGQGAPTPPLAAPVQAAAQAPLAAVAPAPPPPAPTGVAWGSQQMLDYLRQYGTGTTGLSQEQVDALIGKPSAAPNAATVDWNQKQQQFTANNAGYANSGYWGNADQVAAQKAEGAQSAGIPTGVLGTSFARGGADFGGQQNAGNTMNGNNGATNWAGSAYGVPPSSQPATQNASITGGGSFLSSNGADQQQAQTAPARQGPIQATTAQNAPQTPGAGSPAPQQAQQQRAPAVNDYMQRLRGAAYGSA